MVTMFWCLFIVLLMPYLLAGVGGYYRGKLPGGFDNDHPRRQAQALDGAGARAYAAQQNAWEALAVFTVAVFTARLLGADADTAAILSIAFVAFRALHAVSYMADRATLRSLAFVGGLVCALWLFLIGLL